MGKPKVEDPQKVSLKLPSPVAQRLKIEAVEKRTIEAFIVRDALELYWKLAEKQALVSKVMEQDLESRPINELDFGPGLSLAEKLVVMDAVMRAPPKAQRKKK